MPKTSVVHCKTSKYDVYIGRPSMWGNPFILGRDGTRIEVVERYRIYLHSKPELMDKILSLRGKVLGCWCSPHACHGDVLAELADASNP